MLIHAPCTLAPRILCTGSDSSKTTNPKLGSFPPTPLVLIRSSTTFPYAEEKKKCCNLTNIYSHSTALKDFLTTCIVASSRKPTQEELFELALVNVMWEVANKKLVTVWVPDNPPAINVTRFRISPATCRSEQS